MLYTWRVDTIATYNSSMLLLNSTPLVASCLHSSLKRKSLLLTPIPLKCRYKLRIQCTENVKLFNSSHCLYLNFFMNRFILNTFFFQIRIHLRKLQVYIWYKFIIAYNTYWFDFFTLGWRGGGPSSNYFRSCSSEINRTGRFSRRKEINNSFISLIPY